MNSRLLSFFFIAFSFCTSQQVSSQKTKLLDARNSPEGREFQTLLDQKPQEVQFGIVVSETGDVYFNCNNKAWFSNLLGSDSYGITSDIVSKEKYVCGTPLPDSTQMEKGLMISPVYRSDLISNLKEIQTGAYSLKLGNTGHSYFNKQVEGNLLFLVDNRVLAYIKFINLDRTPFHILPMGLYADTLIQSIHEGEEDKTFTYSKSVQITVPFPKSRSIFKPSDFAPLAEALNLKEYQIEKIEIRAYSSVEGRKSFNDTLMQKRAEAMLMEIKKSQAQIPRINILTAENWLEFLEDIKTSEFSLWAGLSKQEIKKRILDKPNADKIEPLLSKERKAVVSVFLSKKTEYHELNEGQILSQFQTAVSGKKVGLALLLEQEIMSRIKDNRLPDTYLSKLEIPESVDFIPLINQKLLFPLLYKQGSERDALNKFLTLKRLDPNNSKVNYNILALRLNLWEKENDNKGYENLAKEIRDLEKLGINSSLVKRMLINHYILLSSDQMNQGNYPEKNKSLKFIGETYTNLKLNDQEIYSLAKYFSFYGRMDWALNLVSTRIDQLDIDEDLLFYFLNLEFYDPGNYKSDFFKKGILNAININRARFCRFFTPADQNGASIQLLEYSLLKKFYCGSCINPEP